MKRILTLIMLSAALHISAQTLTLEQCYGLARQNYPLLKQRDIIEKTKDYTIQNAWRGYIPQLIVNGQATYQSETTNFKDVFGSLGSVLPPNVKFPTYSKDQYRLTGEVNQTIFDGEASKFKKENAKTQAAIQEQNLEVNLYSLRDRVNQVFFGILLIDQQLLQNAIQQNDIQNGIDKTTALVNNGTAYRSSIDELKAQMLQVQQTSVELQSSRRSFMMVLGLLTNQTLGENTLLEKPLMPSISDDIKRPELTLYNLQKRPTMYNPNNLKPG